MDIVLSVLQILGWILLALLLLFVVVLLVILFCPLRYQVEGEWLEEKWAKFKAHWLLHLFGVKISYGDDLIYGEAHVLWKKFTFSYDLTKKEDEADVEDATVEMENDSEEEASEVARTVLGTAEPDEKVVGTESAAQLRGESTEKIVEEPASDSKEIDLEDEALKERLSDEENEDSLKDEEKESIVSKIKGILERIKEIYQKIKKILSDEKNQDAIKHLKNEVICLIKIFLPKKSKVDAVFSTGSPDTTGQLFGILALFPGMYQKNWKIIPDFQADDPYFKGTFWGKGRIRVSQFVGIVLRILFDKNCRRLYTILNKFINSIKNDKSQEEK